MPATVFSQENRVIKINTPLGKDVLLLSAFSGQEAVSSLFEFYLELIAENRHSVAFDRLLGQKINIEVLLPDDRTRYFHGIVSSFSQGGRDERFTSYRAVMVPQFWLLTRTFRSRIFQQISIPDILKRVLQGLDVSYELQAKYETRVNCRGIFASFGHPSDALSPRPLTDAGQRNGTSCSVVEAQPSDHARTSHLQSVSGTSQFASMGPASLLKVESASVTWVVNQPVGH